MKKANNDDKDADILKEYEFSKGIRGKYAERYAEGTNIVILSPDVAEYFSDSESVNSALRVLIEIAKRAEERHSEPSK